jgi:hypothetical protein
VAEQVHRPAMAEGVDEGIEVVDEGLHADVRGRHARREAGAALVVEHHLVVVGQRLQRQQVAVVGAGAAMQHDDHGPVCRAEVFGMEAVAVEHHARHAGIELQRGRHLGPGLGRQSNEQGRKGGDEQGTHGGRGRGAA